MLRIVWWIGHTLRKTDQQCHQACTEVEPTGKEEPRPSRNSWRRTVDDEAGKAGYTLRQIKKLAQNRIRQGRIQDFSRGRGVAGTLGLQNQWGMPPKCCNLRIGT